jgi:regulator of protease activity HflC (stomatin/prohibitin superfamily)
MPALGLVIPVALIVLWFLSGIRIVNEYENGVVLRLGRFAGVRTAGLKWIVPFIDRMIIIDMRITAEQVPPQDVITRDNVSVKVNAVIYFRVMQADRAFLQVTDFLFATSQFAQTTLRSVLGQVDLDDLLSQRDKINRQLQEIIDRHTEPWGVKVTAVEVKQVDLPEEMRRAMAKQAEAERERRSKIIAAEGEFQAADKLSQAAAMIGRHPVAIQLRFLQTLIEVGAEHNSTTIFPVPIDLFQPFIEAAQKQRDDERASPG